MPFAAFVVSTDAILSLLGALPGHAGSVVAALLFATRFDGGPVEAAVVVELAAAPEPVAAAGHLAVGALVIALAGANATRACLFRRALEQAAPFETRVGIETAALTEAVALTQQLML